MTEYYFELSIKPENHYELFLDLLETLTEDAIEENDGVSLDFYNDWVNGVLYFPLWFWRSRKKKNY